MTGFRYVCLHFPFFIVYNWIYGRLSKANLECEHYFALVKTHKIQQLLVKRNMWIRNYQSYLHIQATDNVVLKEEF